MPKRRVILVRSQYLFGESIEEILRADEDVQLIGPWDLSQDVCGQIEGIHPDVIVLADEDPQSEEITRLTLAIMERYPELSVIRAGMTENVVRVFSTHLLPARSADLLETIRNLPIISEEGHPPHERSE